MCAWFRYLEVKSDFKCRVDETAKQSCGTEDQGQAPYASGLIVTNYPVLGRVDSQSPCNEPRNVCAEQHRHVSLATEQCQMIMVSHTASVGISCALTLV